MDDFLKFIFIAFIVISFFRRFLKNAKPPETNTRKTPDVRDDNTVNYPKEQDAATVQKSSDDFAILREIENMFKIESEQPANAEPVQSSRGKLTTKIEEHSQRQSEVNQTPSEKTIKVQKVDTSYTNSEHVITEFKRPHLSKEVETRALAFERSMSEKKEDTSGLFNHNLRSKLSHPQALKDYIIISEILGKPKAFD